MKRMIIAAALAVGLSGGAVFAAELQNANGQSCGDFEGTWHFVNNQIGGATDGLLTVSFTSGTQVNIAPSKVTPGTIHFLVIAEGELLSGSTNLPGRLVLSDFSCDDKKDPPSK